MDEQTNTGMLNQLTYIDLFHHHVLLQNYALRDENKAQQRPGEGLQELEPSSEGLQELEPPQKAPQRCFSPDSTQSHGGGRLKSSSPKNITCKKLLLFYKRIQKEGWKGREEVKK